MLVITAIKPQKSKKRVNIYLDGKFGFGLDLENFIKLNLKVEQELSEVEIEEIVKKAEYQKMFQKITMFAALRPRSEKEIRDWLKRKKVHDSLANDLFSQLKRLELVDDNKFSKWWIEQRATFRPRSKRMLRYELGGKGVGKDIIDNAMSETNIDEAQIARQLVDKKKYRWEKLDKQEAKKKKAEFLGRKGFSWNVIREVV